MSDRKRQQEEFFHGSWRSQVARMLINLLTCSGAGLAAISIFLAFSGQIRHAWLLVALAVLIDAIDGTLIRSFNLKPMSPQFDGERLDEYADLLTFVIAPAGIAVASNLFPNSIAGIATLGSVVAVSCLQFSYRNAKTSLAFWGFPSYWNIVFFYGWALSAEHFTMMILTWVLILAVFLPLPFLYPTRTPHFRIMTLILGLIWAGILIYYLLIPEAPRLLVLGSLFYPVYYIGMSLFCYPYISKTT